MVKRTIEDVERSNVANKDLIIASIKAAELNITYGQLQVMEYTKRDSVSLKERQRKNRDEKVKADCIQALTEHLQNVAVSFRQSIRLVGPSNSKVFYKYAFGFSNAAHNIYWIYPYKNIKVVVLCRAGEVSIFKSSAIFDTAKSKLGFYQIGQPANCVHLEDYLPSRKANAERWRSIFS